MFLLMWYLFALIANHGNLSYLKELISTGEEHAFIKDCILVRLKVKRDLSKFENILLEVKTVRHSCLFYRQQ